MRMILAVAGFFLAITCASVTADDAIETADDFVLDPHEIGTFRYGNARLPIWTSIRSSVEPQLRQFRYEPLFIPLADPKTGKMIIDQPQPSGSTWKITVPILLSKGDETDQVALNEIQTRGFTQAMLGNVTFLPLKRISFRVDKFDTDDLYAGVKIPDLEIRRGDSVDLEIDCPTEEVARRIVNELPNLTIEYTFTFAAKTAKTNDIMVSVKQMANSKLHTALNGVQKDGKAHIHRDDLRALVTDAHIHVTDRSVIEAPEHFNRQVADKMLTDWLANASTPITASKQDALASTFNANDLTPDVIEAQLNKMFDLSDDTEHVITKQDYKLDTKANFFKKISGELSANVSLSKDAFQHRLRQHDVTVDFKGRKIVVKDVSVLQVNMADFNDDRTILSVSTYITGPMKAPQKGSMQFNNLLRTRTVGEPIPTRLEKAELGLMQLVLATPPIGTIHAFAGNVTKDMEDQGWLRCDGSRIEIARYPELFKVLDERWGDGGDGPGGTFFSLPDLSGRFLRGVNHGDDDATRKQEHSIENGKRNPLVEKRDPDVGERFVLKNGRPERLGVDPNIVGPVGSYQNDSLHAHFHLIPTLIGPGNAHDPAHEVVGFSSVGGGGFRFSPLSYTDAGRSDSELLAQPAGQGALQIKDQLTQDKITARSYNRSGDPRGDAYSDTRPDEVSQRPMIQKTLEFQHGFISTHETRPKNAYVNFIIYAGRPGPVSQSEATAQANPVGR